MNLTLIKLDWVRLLGRSFVLLGITTVLYGCGDFFAQKPTEIESKAILEELSQVRESPHTENPLPEAYRLPTQRLAIKDGVKLFYFTKHHAADHLAVLVKDQLGVDSTVNPTTNQIVAYCKDDVQADAVQQYLNIIDVSPIQVNVDCLILERFGDITMDWETTLLVEDLLTEGRMENVGLQNVLSQEQLIDNQLTLGELKYPRPAFPGASLRESERANFGLDFGYWIDRGVSGEQIRMVVDVLVSRGYLKILLNPQLETINGKAATVTIKDYAPIEEVKTGSGGSSGVYNITKYVWVENTLQVTPHVYSDGSVGLQTHITIGSRSKPEGVVQRSIITERTIDVDENRIEPGRSLIIGGMRKSEKRSVVRGIPFLKDLPLMGVFFSSKDFEEKGTEIIFVLTPSVSSGGVENSEIVKEIRSQYEEPEYRKKLTDAITSPLGKDAYTKALEKEATEAELDRVQAKLDLELAQIQAQTEKERADQAEAQAQTLRQRVQELQILAEEARKQAEEAAQFIESAKSQAQTDLQKIQDLDAQKQQITQQLEQAHEEAQRAAQLAQESRDKAEQSQERVKQAQEQLKKAEEAIDTEASEEPQP